MGGVLWWRVRWPCAPRVNGTRRKAKPRPGPGRKTSCCIDTSWIGGPLSNRGNVFASSVNSAGNQRTETQPTSRVRLFAMLTTPSEPILEQTRLRGASALGSAGMHGAFGREAQFRGKSTSQPKLRRRNRPKVQAGFALPYASRKAKPRPLGPGRKTSCCIDTSFIGGLLSNGGGLFARSVNIVLGS